MEQIEEVVNIFLNHEPKKQWQERGTIVISLITTIKNKIISYA